MTWTRCLLLLCITFTGCSPLKDDVVQQMRKAGGLELYSLEPFTDPNDESTYDCDPEGPGERLHGWRILGKVNVSDETTRRTIIDAIQHAIERGGLNAKCSYPRHAIRYLLGGKTVDIVICFQCQNFAVHRDGDHDGSYWPIAPDLQPILDETLTKAGISLAKKRN